jgi:hypothetical protein
VDLCLNADQAKEAKDMTCTTAANSVQDPYDPSCALAYLQDPTEISCLQALDSDGNPCEYCTLQGMLNMCLNAEQAEMGIGMGISCDDARVPVNAVAGPESVAASDPFDRSCMNAFWKDQSEEVCVAAVDQSGVPCEYCSLPGSVVICLTSDQAAISQQLGMECSNSVTVANE